MTCILKACIALTYMVMASIVMAYTVALQAAYIDHNSVCYDIYMAITIICMAYISKACIVMAYIYGLCSHGLYSLAYRLHSRSRLLAMIF